MRILQGDKDRTHGDMPRDGMLPKDGSTGQAFQRQSQVPPSLCVMGIFPSKTGTSMQLWVVPGKAWVWWRKKAKQRQSWRAGWLHTAFHPTPPGPKQGPSVLAGRKETLTNPHQRESRSPGPEATECGVRAQAALQFPELDSQTAKAHDHIPSYTVQTSAIYFHHFMFVLSLHH